jgi:hypothetical protein
MNWGQDLGTTGSIPVRAAELTKVVTSPSLRIFFAFLHFILFICIVLLRLRLMTEIIEKFS